MYRFSMIGETTLQDRRTFRIAFEPVRKESCFTIGADNECRSRPWKGEIWVDAEEMQPARITTDLAVKVPWGIRVFLGTNLRQTGFSITYRRVGHNVWFPAAYGAEFHLDALWFYKRTITLSLDSANFRKTSADSTIDYTLP